MRQPKLWQCYRPRFFLFLSLMIFLGATLSRLASDHYWLLSAVAGLDISVAIALLNGGKIFWRPLPL
ncbi:MAG: hypothetical protein J7K75_13035 [Desulfuromonas sp.]|nr:hypothetical protein [Desulfuromonas sp.]